MKERKQITVAGRVQGVYFRVYTQQKAQELGLNGYVQNNKNGSVSIEAEGDAASVQALAEWCNQGSPLSNVRSVEIKDMDSLVGYTGFIIKR